MVHPGNSGISGMDLVCGMCMRSKLDFVDCDSWDVNESLLAASVLCDEDELIDSLSLSLVNDELTIAILIQWCKIDRNRCRVKKNMYTLWLKLIANCIHQNHMRHETHK